MAAGTEQPFHAELTTMDLLLKERGWDRSKFCQTWGKGSRCGKSVNVRPSKSKAAEPEEPPTQAKTLNSLQGSRHKHAALG